MFRASNRLLLLFGLLLIIAEAKAFQNAQPLPAPTHDAPSASLLAQAPRTWAMDAAANELIVLHHPNTYLRYHMHVRDEKGDKVRDVLESRNGTVARLIRLDGKPLTDDEDKGERQRLQAMIDSPADFARHIKNENSGKKLADDIIRMMPDAMIYTYVPDQPQTSPSRGLEIVMDYQPDPRWKPPTTASAALTGLRGRVWIDAKTRYIVRMEGDIFQAVNFGWGMLAHIYPGGKLVLEQANVGEQRWIFTHFVQEVTVRALMLKTVRVKATADAEEFQVISEGMTYQDAVHLLLNTPLPKQ